LKKTKIVVSIHRDFLSVVTTFVERSSIALGLGQDEALRLTLASEEIFSYLCSIMREDKGLEVTCTGGLYFVAVDFFFGRVELSLQAFNITAGITSDKVEDLEDMGLLIAARSVDQLSLEEIQGGGIVLRLIKNKAYPSPQDMKPPETPILSSYSIRPPTQDEIKVLSSLILRDYRDHIIPHAFRYPGRLIDMVASTIYKIVIAGDDRGFIGGGAMWRRMNEKIVEFYGPYLFNQKDNLEMAESLFNACLEQIARTEIMGLLCRFTTDWFPRALFEPIGTAVLHYEKTGPKEITWYYRGLNEDTGTHVHVPKKLAGYMEHKYRELALPREVYITDYSGEYMGEHSVFASDFDRELNQVIMRLLWPGRDSLENIKRHLAVFKKERILNTFFAVDLGVAAQASIVESLMECGFEPKVLIPYGGRSDLVICQFSP